MTIEPLIPDVAPAVSAKAAAPAGGFSKILDDVGSALAGAQVAENAFASGAGDLQSAVYERARADVALSVATAAAQRTAQALQSIFSMQV